MSFRYIAPIFTLSICHVLCGADSTIFGSPVTPENVSFSGIECQNLSRQGSNVSFDAPTTPLSTRDPNKPRSRTTTPGPSQQSELLTLLSSSFDAQYSAGQGYFQNLSEAQRIGLYYRNKQIVETIYSMIINDAELGTVTINARHIIATLMARHIADRLKKAPHIWNNIPYLLKEQIINSSAEKYSSTEGYFHILEGWISLEEYAAYAKPPVEQRMAIPRINSLCEVSGKTVRRRGGGFTE
jgi:hypothetical protein